MQREIMHILKARRGGAMQDTCARQGQVWHIGEVRHIGEARHLGKESLGKEWRGEEERLCKSDSSQST
jgi:hypothetical protein